jgi:galactose mutarotase-like enzyme
MIAARCDKTNWGGLEALELRALDYGACIIPSLGASVVHLWYEKPEGNFEILRFPNADVFLSDPLAFGAVIVPPRQSWTYANTIAMYSVIATGNF